jgi:alpha-L-fucosidase
VHEPGDPKLGTWLIDGHIKNPREHIGDPISDEFREEGYRKFIEVIDKYRPDQLQIDGGTCVRLGEDRLKRMLAHYFNAAETWGRQVAVSRGYDSHHGYVPSEIWGKEVMISRIIPLSCSIQNIERHFPKITLTKICPDRWQTSTPVPGFSWAYVASEEEKTPEAIEESVNSLVDGIVDVKSKNGVTLMGVAPKPDGTLPDAQVAVLTKLGAWMRVNKEALHGARPRSPCSAGSLRFTRKGSILYAIDLGTPRASAVIPGVRPVPGSTVRMLGSDSNLRWHQDGVNLVVEGLPSPLPSTYAHVFKIQVEKGTERQGRNQNGATAPVY